MDKLKQWVALTVVGVLALLAGGWFLLVSPQRSEAAELEQEAETVLATNASLRNQVKVLEGQAATVLDEEAIIAAFEQKIPVDPALPSLIRALSAAAEETGVEFLTLEPAPPEPGESPPGPAGVLGRIPVEITVNGSYFEVERYLAALEDLPRALRVGTFTLRPADDPSTVDSESETDGSALETVISAEVFLAADSVPIPATVTAAPEAIDAPATAPEAGAPTDAAPAAAEPAATPQ